MYKAELVSVIKTELAIRGFGTPDSPIRRLVQYWSTDGELLAELDPLAPKYDWDATEGAGKQRDTWRNYKDEVLVPEK